MLYIHTLNPVALDLGFLEIRWYGISYALGFLLAWLWLRHLALGKRAPLSPTQAEDLLFAALLGVILGGRIGYFLFYRTDALFSLELFKIWSGGMSFHGGLLGVLLALLVLAKRWRKPFLALTDILALPAALALVFGRLANFVNGELWGRPTDGSWGVIFPNADAQPRFPSQLFEATKNLLIAGILLLTLRQKPRRGSVSFLFLILYGAGRIAVEAFWREPADGFIWGISKGAFYSLPLLLIGVVGLVWINSINSKS